MLGKSKLLPVLIGIFVLALTPVFAYAGPKDTLDDELVEAIVEAADVDEDAGHGALVSWVAKASKDLDSLADSLEDYDLEDLEGFNHGQIVSAIAKSKAEANDDSEVNNEEDDEEASEQGKGHAYGKVKNADKHDVNTEDDDEGEGDDENEGDDDPESSAEKIRGKSADNKHKGANK